ncbi:bifunctional nuclease domain-containing protein [Halofilum ochraceum]|uniref:bifunctional nuclease domain-containing protein n=1 Tax=Halofilum ochraceum TaxID=1611323 RepID=UPI00082D5CAF|nr:bifunctional nuclease domain-containing protein [Halofilum ochraceum]
MWSRLVTTRAALLAAFLLIAAPAAAAAERELAAAVDEFVEVEVATVGMATPHGVPVVLLREPGGGEMIPIFIGHDTARAIILALRDAQLPRPMTHDLLGDVIGSLDARLTRMYVDDIAGNTFLGMLELEAAGREEPIRVDTRPSDGIALALRTGASIHVAPEVLEEARLINYRGLDESEQIVSAVGITVMAPTAELREALGLPDREGVVVTEAVGTARGAGLEPGALVLAVNGETPDSPMGFLQLVQKTPESERVRIRYWLDGTTREVRLHTDVPDRPGQNL